MADSNETLEPFRVSVPQARLDWIAARVAAYPWPAADEAGWAQDWEFGVSLLALKDLCGYWLDTYDWRAWEARLNAWPQFMAKVPGGPDIHCYVERGSGPSPVPLLLLHGWPGSVFEFLHLIEPLAHPERFGGRAEDGFTVIVPSLPGYGFSPCPARPIGPRGMARRMTALMRALGFDRYLIQGGDWGALVGSWMAYEGGGCDGLHLNLMGWEASGFPFETDDELAYAARRAAIADDGLGYAHQQRTRPQTLSVAMRDSPVGTCAWILEKFHGWSDTRRGFEAVYTHDQLLTNIMIYLVTDSFSSAAWAYKGRELERTGEPPPAGARLTVPTAIANFPREFIPFPPRSYVERLINVVRWTDFAEGGHFPALERPDDLRRDIQAFARQLRG